MCRRRLEGSRRSADGGRARSGGERPAVRERRWPWREASLYRARLVSPALLFNAATVASTATRRLPQISDVYNFVGELRRTPLDMIMPPLCLHKQPIIPRDRHWLSGGSGLLGSGQSAVVCNC